MHDNDVFSHLAYVKEIKEERKPLTSAWIVLQEELVQSDPTAAHTHHDSGSEDPHQSQLLGFAKLEKVWMEK